MSALIGILRAGFCVFNIKNQQNQHMKDGWKEKFITSLRKKGNVSAAAKAAGINRCYAYETKEADKDFEKQWNSALEESCDLLEEEARRRAHDGVLEPVFYKGDKIALIRKYSDTLLIVLLKAHRPNKFRENAQIEHVGSNGGPIQVIGYRINEPSDKRSSAD